MRKLTKTLLIAIAAVSLGWSLLSSVYTHEVSEKLADLKRENHSDVIYLRARIRELENELALHLWDRLTEASKPVGGPTAAETEGEDKTEEITLPIHQSPETQAPPADTTAPTALYLLAEHEGVIGVFDASGELLRTINVFVMTLPEVDRAALEVGIPAYSWQEMCDLAAKYE